MFDDIFANAVTWAPALLRGAATTVVLTVVITLIGTVLGALLGIIRVQRIPFLNLVLIAYVEVFRGLPAIVLLFIAYFGLPAAGITISDDPAVVGVVALGLQLAAYNSEVFRAAILAVDPGQRRAGLSLGMSTARTYVHVILPQAFLISIPTLSSVMIGILKETSLLSFISVSDLLKVGNDINSATFLSFQVYAIVGVIYIILSLVTSRVLLLLERRLRHHRRPARAANVGDAEISDIASTRALGVG